MSNQGKVVTPSEAEVPGYGNPGGGKTDPAGPVEAGPAEQAAMAGPEEGAARSEAEEWRDKFLRARAELSNYQKRVEKDRLEAMRYAHAELARALLPVIDDLDRILENAAAPNATREALAEGVRLTRENFLKILQQFHVTPIEAHGEPFDPSIHEALLEQQANHAEPTVLQEVTRGYRLHDRVLRPSKVIVSRSIAVSPEGTEGKTAES